MERRVVLTTANTHFEYSGFRTALKMEYYTTIKKEEVALFIPRVSQLGKAVKSVGFEARC